MCNPDDIEPCISGTPSQAAIQGDTRSPGQRNHDALLVAARALLASGDLGQHNGLPTSIIVTTTLQELEAGAGKALTGGGTILPMADVIRLGSHAHHYLAIFHNGKALALYHTKRLASPAQRIMLHARDRGCTFPGCTVPGYLCQVHHNDPYATNPVTDVNPWRSPATPTTNKPTTATTPAPTPAAKPNGSHHHTSTEDNPASTPTTTPKNCYATTGTTTVMRTRRTRKEFWLNDLSPRSAVYRTHIKRSIELVRYTTLSGSGPTTSKYSLPVDGSPPHTRTIGSEVLTVASSG